MANPSVRTAPNLTVATGLKQVSLGVIDASGDVYSEAFYVPVAMTQIELEALVANYQLNTQGSVYEVRISEVFAGDADPDNADTLMRNSIKQGINMLFKDSATAQTTTVRVVAPIPAIMQGNQDIPLNTAPLPVLISSFLIALAPETMTSMQYTERRERSNNPRIKV